MFPWASSFLLKSIINRHRNVRCNEIRTAFEIPRILATSDIALRLLHTHYDHVTPLHPVPTLFQLPTSTRSHSAKDKANNVQGETNKELREEYKQPENEGNSVQEEEIKVEEQGDTETQTVRHIYMYNFFPFIISVLRFPVFLKIVLAIKGLL